MTSPRELSNLIWGIAELIRDHFKRGHYQDVILPFTVLRRIDCVLEPTKQDVVERNNQLKGRLENLGGQLTAASGYAFYNTSPYTFERLLRDAPNLADNLRRYLAGFSPNMSEVLDRFDFPNTIARLDEAGLLFLVMQRFRDVDLHPNVVSNAQMGQTFEELIRRFNEALNENPGEHFTPREVVRLMVDFLVTPDRQLLGREHLTRTVYDPACGTGGMLTIARQRLEELSFGIDVHLFGQEVNPETWAIAKADLFMLTDDGRDADNVRGPASTLSNDQLRDHHFDYLITNPPYGKDWKADADAVDREAERGFMGRFGAGLPRKSDGQMLFLQHLIGRMKRVEDGGARVAIVMNGSPLFAGDAGGGESEIRRWILESDLLEAIVALPEQIFYNTGIATYVWLLTNRKEARRLGKVQLIDATGLWTPMRRNLGDKRRELSDDQIAEIVRVHGAFEESKRSKIFRTTAFGYRKVTVDRPLRVSFCASPERIARLEEQKAFQNLAVSKKKDVAQRDAKERAGRELQGRIREALATLPSSAFTNRGAFDLTLDRALKPTGVRLTRTVRAAIYSALGERDESAEIARGDDGLPEHDPKLRDTEQIPLSEDIQVYFEREVQPFAPNAWINTAVRDPKDGQVGVVGYEINFNRYFYEYQQPRRLEEIEADIKSLEGEIVRMLREITAEPV